MPPINNAPFLFRNSTPGYIAEKHSTRHRYGIARLTIEDNGLIRLTESNPDFLQLTGQQTDDLTGINLKDNQIWRDDGQLWRAICRCLAEKKTQVINWTFSENQTRRSVSCSIIPTFAQNAARQDRISSLTLVVINNTADREFADQIHKYNYYDHLTGLPNKAYLNEVFDSRLAEKFPGGEVAILLINILKFQRINEGFGYKFGDDVIRKIVQRIEFCLPENAMMTRFDGDKFAILIGDEAFGVIKNEAGALASSIHHEMKKPVEVDHHNIHLGLCIGVAIGAATMKDNSLLIQQAHIAMQRLNNKSKSRTLVYQPELQTRANSRLKLENELREDLKKNQLSLDYQPIINLQTGGLIGFEALCRWRHSERGAISPLEFIPLAEETGLIIPLGNWALREACLVVSHWINRYPGISNLVMNVNVTGLQLLEDDFVATTREALLNAGIDGHHLKLEITESTLIENSDLVRDILLDLKALGISLAIDDFGTGYSSLSYLNRFPADTLKIDKSFVNRMNANEDSFKIIYIISTLAQTLGMNLVAEGIETEDHMKSLKNLGCQAGQGYLFARPLSLEDAEAYIRKETFLRA